jgi:hypothetical protein
MHPPTDGFLHPPTFYRTGATGSLRGRAKRLWIRASSKVDDDYSAAERGPSLPCVGSTKAPPRWWPR